MTLSATGVCVVIAAKDAADSIGRAVGSALAQQAVHEVIVVDDASSDSTAAAARVVDDGSRRLKVIRLEENRGPAAARNRALAVAEAPLVCVLDADDYLLPGRMDRLLAAADGEWDLLADDIVIVPQELQHVGVRLGAAGGQRATIRIGLEAFVRGNISRPGRPRGELGFLKPLIRRSFLDTYGLRYDESLRLGEDYALYLRALAAGARFHAVGACGYIAVERGNSISGRHSAADLHALAHFDAVCLTEFSSLSAGEHGALKAHLRATIDKAVHRDALDIKRTQGVASALLYLARHLASLPHVAAETLRAKRRALGERIAPRSAGKAASRVRLVGATGSAPHIALSQE